MKKSSFKKDTANPILLDVMRHYDMWTEDNEHRMNRPNGWNAITDAYYGKLPSDWPYISKVVDPCIRTSIIEKDARLLNQKLRGRVVPREGGDVLKARLNNALTDFQWDNANEGGSMLEKTRMCSQDTRLYGSKFTLNIWKYECDKDKHVLFNGNEMLPLDVRDCGLDPTADHIKNAKWFQHRKWAKIEDLDMINDQGSMDKKIYPGLSELKTVMAEGKSDRRDSKYQNRILVLKGLTDRVGDDKSFPVVELVTEYRRDRWITFAPEYNVILRDIKNPYNHKRIPVSQLRYYAIQGDPLGESEVEPVMSLWKSIQSALCGYLDNMMIHIRPPLKVIAESVRIETIVYGPESLWLVDRPDAVTEHKSNGEAMSYFQTTYQALKSAFNTAMGDTSMGVSAVDPTSSKRTATEIKKSDKQQYTRDQMNQTSLSEFLQDVMSFWISNNRQFLFTDPDMKEYTLRIVGSELFNYFQRAGLDEMEIPDQAMQAIGDIISMNEGNMSDDDILNLMESAKVPKHPVFTNPNEKDPEKLDYKPKMRLNDMGDGAEISLIPDDLEGMYDFVPDVQSMASGANQEMIDGQQRAIDVLTTNPIVLQMLQAEGVKPKMKELLISSFNNTGLSDADRYFETATPQDPVAAPMPGAPQGQPQGDPMQQQGMDMKSILSAGNQQPQIQQPQAAPQM